MRRCPRRGAGRQGRPGRARHPRPGARPRTLRHQSRRPYGRDPPGRISATPDTQLVSVSRSGNGLVARLANTYSGAESERRIDLLVADSATLPNTDLYEGLKPLSHNAGAVDLDRLVAGRAQPVNGGAGGGFGLYRIGDAWAARNIHAAMLDAMRLCRDL